MQIRALLVLGSTASSSNVNETRLEELEMLIEDLLQIWAEGREDTLECILSKDAKLLGSSFAESLLQASLLSYSQPLRRHACLEAGLLVLLPRDGSPDNEQDRHRIGLMELLLCMYCDAELVKHNKEND